MHCILCFCSGELDGRNVADDVRTSGRAASVESACAPCWLQARRRVDAVSLVTISAQPCIPLGVT